MADGPDPYQRIQESNKRAREAARRILEISSELILSATELDKAVLRVKENCYLEERPNFSE